MPPSAYYDNIPCDGRMKSGTQLHSSFSELFHTVKPTDSNECWLWPLLLTASFLLVFAEKERGVLSAIFHGVIGHACVQVSAGLLFFFLRDQVTKAHHRVQSTVDGFFNLEQTHRQRWMFTGARTDLMVTRDDSLLRDEEGTYLLFWQKSF